MVNGAGVDVGAVDGEAGVGGALHEVGFGCDWIATQQPYAEGFIQHRRKGDAGGVEFCIDGEARAGVPVGDILSSNEHGGILHFLLKWIRSPDRVKIAACLNPLIPNQLSLRSTVGCQILRSLLRLVHLQKFFL